MIQQNEVVLNIITIISGLLCAYAGFLAFKKWRSEKKENLEVHKKI